MNDENGEVAPKMPPSYLGAVKDAGVGDVIFVTEIFPHLNQLRGRTINTVYPHGAYSIDEVELYTGQVEWPDGTIAPVPVSQELREAMSDE